MPAFDYPGNRPTGHDDLLGMILGGLADMVKGVPIIGDILGFVTSLFGGAKASNARILRIEQALSQGSKGFDDFNRGNSESSLGKHTSMPSNWVQGGDGEVMGIRDRAANVKTFLTPADGRRWAKYPTAASQNKHSASAVCASRNDANNACTTVIIAANTGFTEFVYANVFGAGGIRLGRGTRSGNSWTFNQWKSSSYRIGTAETVELQSDGAGTYKVVVDNDVVLTHDDTSNYPIDASHRFAGFAIQTWTGILAVPQYGWGVEAFSLRSEADTYTAIETVETVAASASTVAGQAQTKADSVTGIANDANTKATNAEAAAGAVLGVAENASGKADNAQTTANTAYAAAARFKEEFVVASGGVVLGKNELLIGPVLDVPSGRSRVIDRVAYALKSNPNGMTTQLIRVSVDGSEEMVRQTYSGPGVIRRVDTLPTPLVVTDQDRFHCNVTLSGNASVLQCAIFGAWV